MNKELNKEFMKFIKNSPSCFHAVSMLANILESNGFKRLEERNKWDLKKGESYYVTRNDSSILAFRIGENLNDYHYQISASHSDSPSFKIKEKAEVEGKGGYLQINTEGYGGMIYSTWLDRPLSLAGRILLKEGNKISSRLLNIDKDLLLIPNMPIHMERTINDGFKYNAQIDMMPLFSCGINKEGSFNRMLADELNVDTNMICGKDLFLYQRQEPIVWGDQDEFISAPKLDDLECAFASFTAIAQAQNKEAIQVAVCFDNEEVGSLTKQGASSTFMKDTFKRINNSLGYNDEDYHCAIAKSFMISCDNAHALHPSHPEKFDQNNYVLMNKGIVIKHNANQKYTSDAFSQSVFEAVCQKANVDVQHYTNRSDMPGGSTLGNLSNAQVSLHCIDVGLAQLAMHSAFETAGSKDLTDLVNVLATFYSSNVKISGCNLVEIN